MPDHRSARRVQSGFLLAAGVIAIRLGAQPAFARPVASDTIYRLAVDSTAKEYKDLAYVYLLDDGIARIEADGRAVERFHQVVQVIKPRAAAQWAERQFSFRPGHTTTHVEWMRVLKASGELITDKPSVTQASSVPASLADPVYTDTKVVRYSLAGVAPGTLVDIAWTNETTDPFLRGDYVSGWRVSPGLPVLRSRYVLSVPASVTPRIVESHLDFPRREEQDRGRHYYIWQRSDVPVVQGEPFAPDTAQPAALITIAMPLTWSDIARWYNGLSKDRYALSPAVIARVDSIAGAQRTAADTLVALHRWIAKDIRYVSVSLGIGGYQPRWPDSVVTTGFGDCKDKATLFVAAARHLGLTAYPVLLNSSGVRMRDVPSITQFDHAIAAVPSPAPGGLTFLDLTSSSHPPGSVPSSYQGEFGLVVLPDGTAREVTFPKDEAGAASNSFVGEAGLDGRLSGEWISTGTGRFESGLRVTYAEPLDSARMTAMKSVYAMTFPSSTVDTVIAFNGRDAAAPARVTVRLHDAEGFKRAGSLAILTLPTLMTASNFAFSMMQGMLSTRGPRKLPIEASRVFQDGRQVTEMRLRLPEGWKAQLPDGATVTSAFGEFQSAFAQQGRDLRVTYTLAGATGVQPKEKIGELQAWLKAVTNATVTSIGLIVPPVP